MDEKQEKQLKQIQLEMLRCFICICKKYKLKFYLADGTALGAVRHNGFIPWDDDIDISMPRDDYEQFLSIAQNELPDYLFLQTNITDVNYPNNFAKIRNSNTTFIETSVKNIKMNHGVYIDIFPLDGVASSKTIEKIRRIKILIHYIAIGDEVFYSDRKSKSIKLKLFTLLLKVIYPNYRIVVSKNEKIFKKYPYKSSSDVTIYSSDWGDKEKMPNNYFGNGIAGIFEGIEIILPEKYDEYLTHIYGDYMTLPPKDKQIGHHYCSVIDLNKSYKEYFK